MMVPIRHLGKVLEALHPEAVLRWWLKWNYATALPSMTHVWRLDLQHIPGPTSPKRVDAL